MLLIWIHTEREGVSRTYPIITGINLSKFDNYFNSNSFTGGWKWWDNSFDIRAVWENNG